MNLSKAAWITTVILCVVACALLLVTGYDGYAFVLLAVGAAGSLNLL